MKKNVLAFLDTVRGECAAAGVLLDLRARATTISGDAGFFEQRKKVLMTCVLREDWPIVLAHEQAHLRQMVEKSPLWDGIDEAVDDVFEPWLAGKKRDPEKVTAAVRLIQRCELDAERRTARTIREFGLGSVKKHAKQSNNYVWGYEYARRMRRWSAEDPAVVALAPDRLMSVRSIGDIPDDMFDAMSHVVEAEK